MAYFNAPESTTARNGVFATIAIFVLSAWITMSLRLWVRIVMVRSFGWDDALLLVAAICFTGYCTVVVLIETVGGGQKPNELDFPALASLVGMTISSFGLYIGTMVFFKISMGIFYLRLVIRAWQRYVVHATIYINTFYGTILIFVAIFNCGDPSKYLENEIKGVCMPYDTLYAIQVTGSIINAITDWVFALLPIFTLAKASMPLATKVGAGLILCLACGGSIVSLIRIPYIHGLAAGPNFFNTALDICILSTIECGVGISAAAAATLRPLFRSLMDKTNNTTAPSMSFGSRARSALDTTHKDRGSDALFGDWQPVQQRDHHEMEDLERGSLRSYFSLTPVFNNSRVMSKMGISPGDVSGRSAMTSPMAETSTPDSAVPSTSTKGSTSQLLRSKSKRLRREKSGTKGSKRLGQLARQPSVGDQPIPRPEPHIIHQMAQPVPKRDESRRDIYRNDRRRMGSEDWLKAARQIRPPSRMRPDSHTRSGHLKAPGKEPCFSQLPYRPTTSRGPRRGGSSFYDEGNMF